jgi:hypothetical protein
VSVPIPGDVLSHLRLYAAPFANHPPVIITRFPGGKEPRFPFDIGSDRGLGVLLLYASLYRPGAESRAARILAGLYANLGNDIFKLNRVPFEILQMALKNLPIAPDEMEQKRIPGILRSVCDFFYHAGSLGKLLDSSGNWETIVRELSEGIYWMGKHSPWRTKSRYFLWLASFQPGFAERFPQAARFSWPVGDGHTRFYYNIVRPVARLAPESTPETRLQIFTELGRDAFPGKPWRLFQPLDAYLRMEKEHEYLCRKIQGGCQPCALAKLCPAAGNFGVSTR